MSRFETFLFILNDAVAASGIKRNYFSDAFYVIFNPTVKAYIENSTHPVESEVKEYILFLTGQSKKPSWLISG